MHHHQSDDGAPTGAGHRRAGADQGIGHEADDEDAIDAQLSKDAGLSHFEYGVLSGLSEAPDRTLRMSTLAARAEGSLPRLSQVVGRLEKRGFVERRPDPDDGRYTLATLTQAGWDEVQRVAPMHVNHVRHLVFDQLTKAQVRRLTTIGSRIMGTARPDDRFLSADP